MTKEFKELLEEQLKDLEIQLTDGQCQQFYDYYSILSEWNQVMNLTAITEMGEVVTKHFVDSLSLIKCVEDVENQNYSVIDVGTGAGFPGIPLKIAFPSLKVTLLDSLQKRVKFLNHVCEQLGLSDITSIHGRAEDFGRDTEYREKYDLCVSRAVANLSTLSELCLPFVKKGGYFIPYKSEKTEEELEGARGAIGKLSGHVENLLEFQLPNADKRCLIKIKKFNEISKKYPRKAGLPGKEPLK